MYIYIYICMSARVCQAQRCCVLTLPSKRLSQASSSTYAYARWLSQEHSHTMPPQALSMQKAQASARLCGLSYLGCRQMGSTLMGPLQK